jgi:hypothetical protein
MDAPTLTLGKATETLTACSPFAAFALIPLPTDDSENRLARMFAALGMTWPTVGAWPAKTRPKPWKPGDSVVAYGAAVFDALSRAGIPNGPIITAAGEAYQWAMSILPTDEEVGAAVGFTAAPEGG